MKTVLLVVTLVAAPAFADVEEKSSEHRSFANAHELIIDNISGFIEVTASNGSGLDVDIDKTVKAWSSDRAALAKKEVTLEVTQEGGLVRLKVVGPSHDRGDWGYHVIHDFKVRVPRDILLDLRTVDRSHITVKGTSGDFKINSVNGGIELRDMEGSGDAHTVNGSVKVVFANNPKGPSSFHSVNGTLEVVFRPGLNADLRMRTVNGGLFTDFPVAALTGDAPEQRNGKFVWRRNRSGGVRIGSGGPELTFETVNGSVLIEDRER